MPRRLADGFAVPVVFALLVLATLAAFAWSQRLKRDPLVIDHVTFRAVNTNGVGALQHQVEPPPSGRGGEAGRKAHRGEAGAKAHRGESTHKAQRSEPVRAFTPNDDCRNDRMRIRFRVTRSDQAIVQVVKPGGRLVITLARDRYLKRYHFFTFYWGGRDRAGGTAPAGRYKLRVKLLDQSRTLVPPGAILLHQAPSEPLPGCEAAEPGAVP